MKLTRAILFAWWFLIVGQEGRFAPKILMMIGPFNERVECDKMREWVHSDVTRASDCWEGSAIPPVPASDLEATAKKGK